VIYGRLGACGKGVGLGESGRLMRREEAAGAVGMG